MSNARVKQSDCPTQTTHTHETKHGRTYWVAPATESEWWLMYSGKEWVPVYNGYLPPVDKFMEVEIDE